MNPEARVPDAAPGPPSVGAVITRYGLYLGLFTALTALIVRSGDLTVILFRTQDLPLLMAVAAILVGIGVVRFERQTPFALSPPRLIILLITLFVAGRALEALLFDGYEFSRDEILADFDATFFAQGLLLGPLPPAWAAFAPALNPSFMLPIPADVGWVSDYLPGHAWLRALGILTIGSAWVNPFLAALAAFSLYRISRRLWPNSAEAPAVALLLLALSAQYLITSATAWAMTAHLALNLLWLSFFLRNDWRGDAGALATGFLATGLHQLIFHPLFAGPFILHLWFNGQRRRALVYALGYGLIGAFWAAYWQIVLPLAGIAPSTETSDVGILLIAGKVIGLLAEFRLVGILPMILNLLRLIAWQHVLLAPLFLLGLYAVRRGDGIARPLAGGILLMLLTTFILLPWQGHGWGYRYLHGFLGSFCLLAIHGWHRVVELSPHRSRGLFVAGSLISLLILPVHLYQVSAMVTPFRNAYRAATRLPVDIVVVEEKGTLHASDLVRNTPSLSNRPLFMLRERLSLEELGWLCRHHRVAFFDADDALRFGMPLLEQSPFRLAPRPRCDSSASGARSTAGG